MRYSIIFLLISSLAVLTGCDVNIAAENVTSTPVFVTATLPVTAIPLPTQTLLPPTPVPTIPPIEGTTTTQVNVRSETSTASENLGTIAQFSKVQIIGRDASTSWYQIIYPETAAGMGWVRAEYVQVNAPAEIPVIESGSGGGAGMSGLVIQKINVRSGPGVAYELLGELNPNDVVFITGKDESGAWMQIEFASSADGKGWAALEFLSVENIDSIPVIGLASPTEEIVEAAATPQANDSLSIMPDEDSMEAPLARINFSPLGARSARINGSVSSPEGDAEDWIEFTSFNGSIAIQIFCSEADLQVELTNADKLVDTFSLACAEKRLLDVAADQTYFLRLSAADAGGVYQTSYTLVIENIRE